MALEQSKKWGLRLPYPPISGHFSQFGEKATASSSGVAEGISNPSSKSEGMNSLDLADYGSGSLSSKIGALRKLNEEYQSTIKRYIGAATGLSEPKKKHH
ncbi:hypothetical protein OROHE_019516 [Orobanche hederae]